MSVLIFSCATGTLSPSIWAMIDSGSQEVLVELARGGLPVTGATGAGKRAFYRRLDDVNGAI